MPKTKTLCRVAIVSLAVCGCDAQPSQLQSADNASYLAEELSTDWSQSGRTPRNTSFNPFEAQLTAQTAPGLMVQWTVPMDARTVVKRGEYLYVARGSSIVALSAATGQPLWGRDGVTEGITGYAAGRMITAGLGADGYAINGYNPRHGARTYGFEAPVEYLADSRPAPARVWRDWVFVASSAQVEPFPFEEDCQAGMDDADLLGVNVRDGRHWQRSIAVIAQRTAAADDLLFMAGATQEDCTRAVLPAGTFALSAETGATVWHSPVGHYPEQTSLSSLSGPAPIIAGGRVLVPAATSTWAALDERDGSLLWQHAFGARVQGVGELAASTHVLVGAGVRDGASEVVVEGIDAMDGTALYTTTFAGSHVTRPVIAGELVYLGVGPKLEVFALSTGERVAERTLTGDIQDLIVLNGTVYVAASNAVVRLGLSPLPARAQAGNGASSNAAVDASGRYTVFDSSSSNLVPSDTNRQRDVFLFDASTRAVELISRGTNGVPANGASSRPHIDATGRYVVFSSRATNLVADDPSSAEDVFWFDRTTQQSRRLAPGRRPVVSRDGAFVAFESDVQLLPADTNAAYDVYIWSRELDALELVSARADGLAARSGGFGPRLSADGLTVLFTSSSSDLAAGDTNGQVDTFIRDRALGSTESVPFTPYGNAALDVSSQGRYVLYRVQKDPRRADIELELRVLDRSTGGSTRVALGTTLVLQSDVSAVGRISEDGNIVAFQGAVLGADARVDYELLVANQRAASVTAVRNPSGARLAVSLSALGMTPDGSTLAFDTQWSLNSADTNLTSDTYVVHRATGETTLASGAALSH